MSDNGSTGGIGFCGLLTLIFIALKLLNVISWSWWWVLSPLWIPIALYVTVLLIIFLITTIKRRIKHHDK